MRTIKLLSALALAGAVLIAGCSKDEIVPASLKSGLRKSSEQVILPVVGSSTFAVLAGTTITNAGPSLIYGDIGVSPGTAITGFDLIANTISGPGTVTTGLGIVTGTIYAGGPVAAQAHLDANILYNYLVAQVPDTIYAGVTQLDGRTFTPGVYNFAPSANLQVNGTVYLDFQGNSDALFIFQMGSTLVTMAGSNVIALNTSSTSGTKKCTDPIPDPDPEPDPQSCLGSNVYWAVGSSATIDGEQFIGSVIATTTITMTEGANVSGRIWAINGAVTMITDTISVCVDGGTIPPVPPVPPVKICRDFVTGGGWIMDKATFGVSGGIKNDRFWGQLSYNDHSKRNNVKVKSIKVTAYIVIDEVTRQIEGIARLNNKTKVTYKVIVVDNGEPGRNDSFSLELSNGYTASGNLKGGNIQLHKNCDGKKDRDDREKYNDRDEKYGHINCDKDNDDRNDDDDDDRGGHKGGHRN